MFHLYGVIHAIHGPMNCIPILVLLLGLSISAHAVIGETPEECQERYGKPTHESKDGETTFRVYEKNDISVAVHFWKGVAHSVGYTVKRGAKLPKKTLNALLEMNKGDSEWKTPPESVEGAAWESADKSRKAHTIFETGVIFSTKEWADTFK